MKDLGVLLILVGIGAVAYAVFGYDPTVGEYSFDRTINLQRLAIQLFIVLAGGFSFVGGAVFYAVGEIFERYPRKKPAEPATENPDA